MTSKERMLAALSRKKPDRLPITVHQWQAYHLKRFMGGMDQLDAFVSMQLDASVTPWDVVLPIESENWSLSQRQIALPDGTNGIRHTAQTPAKDLTWVAVSDDYTTFLAEHPIKDEGDAEAFLKYWPGQRLDQARLGQWYARTGDHGIVRGFVCAAQQPGPWQELCELAGTQQAIFWAMDEPHFVHAFLQRLTQKKVQYVHEQMHGTQFDLIEHGGGAASSTVISPSMFDEFCVPYDRQIIDALHEHGLKVVYHTCGGMKAILKHLPSNGTDACETLSPPGMGGDLRIQDRDEVRETLGSKVALIGGIDQSRTLCRGTPDMIRAEVKECFETYGQNGGYICSPSDHFFDAPLQNLRAMAEAAHECVY